MEIRQLTPEESAALDAKYGKPLGPVGSIKRDPRYPTYKEPKQTKLNKDRYLELKEEGKTDREVCKEIHLNSTTLSDLKREWGLSRTGRKPKVKGTCKMCESQEFVKGLCGIHYYKQWRWNHAN